MRPAPFIALLLVVSSSAQAAEPLAPPAWSMGLRSAYVIMGGKRPTGGLMPTAEVLHAWKLGGARFAAGGEIGAFGFGYATRWIGVLGGAVAAISGKPWSAPLELRGALHASFGRVPTCNGWGLCIQYTGFYPAASIALAYEPSERVSIGAFCAARRAVTYGWTGWGVEPAIVGRVAW